MSMYPLVLLVLAVVGSSSSGNVVAFHTVIPTRTRIPYLTSAISLSGSSNAEEYDWRQELPSPLNRYRKQSLQVVEGSFPSGEDLQVFCIGTAHISKDSSRDVRLFLETISPDLIFLELCDQRYVQLMLEHGHSKLEKESASPKPNKQRVWQRGRKNKSALNRLEVFSLNKLSGAVQMEADSLGAKHGGEFLAAYEYWNEKHKTANEPITPQSRPMLVLGDRPIAVTAARVMESMTKWYKAKMLLALSPVGNPLVVLSLGILAAAASGFAGTAIAVGAAYLTIMHNFNDNDTEEFMKSMLYNKTSDNDDEFTDTLEKHFEGLPYKDALLGERDVYMACKLYQACCYFPVQQQDDNNERKMFRAVAVVGAAHVDGICSFFSELLSGQNPEDYLPPLLQSKRLQMREEVINELVDATPMLWYHRSEAVNSSN